MLLLFFFSEPPTVIAVHCNLSQDQNTKYILSYSVVARTEANISFVHVNVCLVICYDKEHADKLTCKLP